METVYDWVTMALFAALLVLFLNRSKMDNPPDHVWEYLPPAGGFAFANYLGNEGYGWWAAGLALLASIAYIWIVLKPELPR